MKEILLGSMAGLMVGIAAGNLGLGERLRLRRALAGRDLGVLRALLLALGAGTMLAALLMWLAVIDVDTLPVTALHGGTVLGGIVFGAVLGRLGLAPGTAPVVLGSGLMLEGLCAAAGCAAGAVCLNYAREVFAPLQHWLPGWTGTWFRVTLDKPFLFDGGFLGQGCIGLVLVAAALCIRVRGAQVQPSAEETAPGPVSTDPAEVQEETFVASLPGEEPVVVDTASDEEKTAEQQEK